MFIIDFDITLYNTLLLKHRLRSMFAVYGVTSEDYAKSEDIAIHGIGGSHYDYTIKLHIQILEGLGYTIPHQEVVESVKNILTTNYACDDTLSFLEAIKAKNKKCILLTAGNPDFQMQKIRSIGIENYFDEIVCVRSKKEEYVEAVYTPHEKIFFVNDKLKENLDVKKKREDIVVITKRNPDKNSVEELSASGIPHFETLTQILNYIETYGQE